MEKIIVNDDNLTSNDITKIINKVRAILLIDDKLLVGNYNGVLMLPGGSIDTGETEDQAIIRELQEETGKVYELKSLRKILTLTHYQKDFPSSDSTILNRMINTTFYIGKYKGVDLKHTNMSENEIKANFFLKLLSIDELLNEKECSNPRKPYFDRENEEVLKVLKKL